MKPNLSQVLSCTDEGMHVGGGGIHIHDTQSAQISQKQDGHNTYVCM